MSGYTKLFSSITRSTVWQTAHHVRIVWITMLAVCDRDGIVESSVPGLAREALVSRAECEEALAILSAPDPDSRTPDREGRRIEAVDGGWRLLNHAKYRDKMNADEKRERDAERQRRKRDRDASRDGVTERDKRDASRDITPVTPTSATVRDVAHAEASPSPSPATSHDLEPRGSSDLVTHARPAAPPLSAHSSRVVDIPRHEPRRWTVAQLEAVLEADYGARWAERYCKPWHLDELADRPSIRAVARWCLARPDPAEAAREVVSGGFATPRFTGRRVPWMFLAESPETHAAVGRTALAKARVEPSLGGGETIDDLVADLRRAAGGAP